MSKDHLRIQYISDIHLEQYKIAFEHNLNPRQFVQPDPSAEILVLAGDIGNPEEPNYKLFLEWCSKSWKTVILVAGNHEFYGSLRERRPVEQRLEAIREVVKDLPNVHFLHREKVEVRPGVFVLGCTLWTDVPEENRYDAMASVNDYRYVGATFDELKAWHHADRDWLKAELAAAAGGKAIVVTHHLPTFTAISRKFRGHPLNVCFATGLDALITEGAPVAWFCGHTHEGGEYTVGKTRILLNPRGYPSEHVSTRDPRKVVDLTL